ncbi:non-ribosomal peptide synthetase [Streptomyces dioscori]|uniref:Non-ribosomal peptide synthetase n=1 Tax=Streptomyces dioscori TaxID=2109333 RepID=A0A2P8QF31_9ACTN|nr:non-ribosomal peptide synthetase [Streptomyces dioscori]PSM44847.1 non-ribosomal peptide synthetase [Streptomyces dioscori]
MSGSFASGSAAPGSFASGSAAPGSSASGSFASGPLLAEAVLDQARRTPDALAVADGDHRLDYAALDRASLRVARGLRARGVRAGQAVAVRLPRSWRLVCVMLGIRRAGATVVPLDAQSPAERRRHILDDSAAVALVHDDTGGAVDDGLGEGPGFLLHVGDLLGDLLGEDPRADAEPFDEVTPSTDAATSFLFYTSGTTGRPKGVEVKDAGIMRLADPGFLSPTAGARYAGISNPAFDALSYEVWVPLLTGGTCVVLSDGQVQNPGLLAETLRHERIDALFVTAALFNAVTDSVPHCFDSVGHVLIGGEQLNATRLKRWYRDNPGTTTCLVNAYGPTESSTFALHHPVPRDFDGDTVPVGRPVPATEALLVADGSRIAETDEIGELYLSGAGLASGYRNLPEETAHRFAPLPWHDEGRAVWYRTGDLVRRDATGLFTFVGRADRQVKVRGFRIEPGEVEQQLGAHPAVRQARVCTRHDVDGAHELLAYLVLGAELTYEEYERHLTATLPPYMRPHRTHLVDALPRNANGKVDDAALLSSTTPAWRRTGGAAVEVTDAQREVLEMAGNVLGVSELRPDDRWIPQGGDSLKALRLRFRIRRRWNVELPQSVVLREDFAALTEAITSGTAGSPGSPGSPGSSGSSGAGQSAPPHPAVPDPSGRRSAPATSEQQRLWLLDRSDPHSRAYDVPLAFHLQGTVDEDALRAALTRLVAAHPALRTAFRSTPQGLLQEIGDPFDPWEPADVLDGEDWEPAARRFFAAPFDLAEARMLRAGLLHTSHGPVLLLHLHHIAVDGWSLNVLFRDLTTFTARAAGLEEAEREAAEREETGLQEGEAGTRHTPLDFALWQRRWHLEPFYDEQRSGLRRHYAAQAQEPSQLTSAVTNTADTGARLLTASLDLVQRSRLDRLGAELGLTRFQLLLAAFSWSLYGVTGQTRPLVASPVSGRPVGEFASTVGMFANTVLLPLRLQPGDGLRGQLGRQAAEVQQILDRQDVTLADVLTDHDFGGGPLFDFMFVLENTDFGALSLPDCRVRPAWPQPIDTKCALTLSVVEQDFGFDCLWEYAAGRFDAEVVASAHRLFVRAIDLLTAADEDEDWSQGQDEPTLAALVAPYRRALPDPGRGARSTPAFTTVAEGFAAQVRRTPYAPALTTGDHTLTYTQLDAHARTLAAELAARLPLPSDPGAPARVALHLTPSAEHIVALLAAAQLNLTVVPLDPAYPPALLRRVLRDAAPLCVLTAVGAEEDVAAIASPELPRHPIDLAAAVPSAPRPVPHAGLRPLYTLFTSGSTGTPKGVDVPDLTLCNLLHWQTEGGGLGEAAVTQQFSMLSFDVSFQEVFTTLCSGGRLHLVRPEWRQDLPALLDQLEQAGVERLFLPCVALQLLAEHAVHLGRFPSRLREVVTAGEQLLCTDAIRRWFAGLTDARLFNHYGPTETHVVSGLCLDGDPMLWPTRPAIGRPVANAVLRVTDDSGEPLPPGAVGRLLIGGPMASPCYLGDAELNRSRFTELPGHGHGTFYRSGDLAHFDAAGLLHFDGRDDDQIKLSGHRLELGQLEAALLRHPSVIGALVSFDGDSLVALLQCRGDDPDPGRLNEHLAGELPPFARIRTFRRVEALPRTPSGKLDRRAVATQGRELGSGLPPERRGSGAPESALRSVASARETRLCELFATVTGKRVLPDQRFFDAGAGSLDLMRFQLRCGVELGLSFTVADLFEHVTVRSLSRFLDTSDPVGTDAGAGAASTATTTTTATAREPVDRNSGADAEPIAVVGMAVRLPGAPDLASFWRMVESGERGIEHFPAAEGRVGARSQMDGLLAFDPHHFGISPQEARLMDPQQRHLLMSCVEALAHAGIADPAESRVGLIAGCGENTYFQSMLREADPAALPDGFRLALHHDKDFLATKAAYHLNLTGPAFTVQAACASSLVGVHIAAGLLRQGEADVMLAGGVLVDTLLTDGYTYRPQHIFSPDGHCRPFSDDAAGTVGASGVGVVVLKPLSLAERDGDTVYAVVTGSALNNDGASKLGYSAPSVSGQREVIRTALRRSGRPATDLGYVEAHGTGTRLGDPVEVGALRQALDLPDSASCALSSVKSQIGHLGAAAGVVGLVRAALAVHHGVIPPNVDFRRLNPEIGADPGPFRIPTSAQPWPTGRPRVAAVSSFGIGGTNAHLILEQHSAPASARTPEGPGGSVHADRLVLSGSSEQSLRTDARRIADHLAAAPQTYDQVLRHLRSGRPTRTHRVAADCPDAEAAVAWLRRVADGSVHTATGAGDVADVGRDPVDASPGPRPDTHPAPPPWDFPPPAFALTDYDFPRAARGPEQSVMAADAAAVTPPVRMPENEWLHQTEWARLRRAVPYTGSLSGRPVVVVTDGTSTPVDWKALHSAHSRVVHVTTGPAYARSGTDRYEVDPADPASLARLLRDVGDDAPEGFEWLHALPLGVEGPVGEGSLEDARRVCLDHTAALCQAVASLPPGARPRLWWLSHSTQPVTGEVSRPELGLLAAAVEVPRQELGLDTRWIDLPSADPSDWAHLLPVVLADATTGTVTETSTETSTRVAPERRTALRQGYWWRPVARSVPRPPTRSAGLMRGAGLLEGDGTHLVLGGTGGIGTGIATWLLEHTEGRVVLLARRAQLPPALARWSDRVTLVAADLAEESLDDIVERCAPHTGRLHGIVHAAGSASGALLIRRDSETMRDADRAKLNAVLLTERLIARHAPRYAAYCSSLSALFGGVGQFDYAAANGVLDAFAHHGGEASATVRLGIGWDVWRDAGMARDALGTDARHQAHLRTGLSTAEGLRVFADAMELQLPHLLVSSTPLEASRYFYEPEAQPAEDVSQEPVGAATPPDATELMEAARELLGTDTLDPAASLYDLGADSLTLLDLLSEVKRLYGVDIELSHLSHQVSVNDLLARLGRPAQAEGPADDPVTIETWQTGDDQDDVLCVIHPVGGDIQAYRPLVSALDARTTVCLVPDPALHDPGLPHWSVAERADRYLAALRARFPDPRTRLRLAGWSFGALVAHSMAASAEAAGRPVERLYLLDPPAPQPGTQDSPDSLDEDALRAVFEHELHGNKLQSASPATGLPGATEATGTTGARATGTTYAERLAHCCRANISAMTAHTAPRLTRTPSALWVATEITPDLPLAPPEPTAAEEWTALLAHPAQVHHVQATHYEIVTGRHVQDIARAIDADR